MDWHAWVGVAAGVIQFISFFPYAYSIIWGTTRPSFVANSLWTTLGVIEVGAQWSAGASWSIVLVGEVTFNTALITLLSVIGYGYKKWGAVDVGCFTLACAALVGWYVTGNPLVALGFSFGANFFASIPAFRKAHLDPHSEQFIGWFLVVFASICGILSSTLWNPANLLIPGYLLFESSLMSGLIFFGQRAKKI